MDVLGTFFVVEKLDLFLSKYVTNVNNDSLIEELKQILLYYESHTKLPTVPVNTSCKLTWQEFKDRVYSQVALRDSVFSDEPKSIKYSISTTLLCLLETSSWKNLYDIAGTDILFFVMVKCYLAIPIQPNVYKGLNNYPTLSHLQFVTTTYIASEIFKFKGSAAKTMLKKVAIRSGKEKYFEVCKNVGKAGKVVASGEPTRSENKACDSLEVIYNKCLKIKRCSSLSVGTKNNSVIPNIALNGTLGLEPNAQKRKLVHSIDFTDTNETVSSAETHLCISDPEYNAYNSDMKQQHRKKVKLRDKRHSYDRFHSLSWQTVLYTKNMWQKWPKYHILGNVQPNEEGADKLIDDILKTDVGLTLEPIEGDIKQYLFALKKALVVFIRRHKVYMPFTKILNRHKISPHPQKQAKGTKGKCNNSASEKEFLDSITTQGDVTISETIANVTRSSVYLENSLKGNEYINRTMQNKRKKKYLNLKSISRRMILRFIADVLRLSVPDAMFGCRENRIAFVKSLERITLYGKGQVFRLEVLLKGLVANKGWFLRLPGKNGNGLRYNIFAKFWLWFLYQFIFILLKTHFYITDTAQSRNKMCFFLKPHWHSCRDYSLRQLVCQGSIQTINIKKAKLFNEKTPYGIIRFLSRRTGARPIINIKYTADQLTQIVIARLFLTQLCTGFRGFVGNQTRSLHTTWRQLASFQLCKPIFCVRVDIYDAFGSIRHDLLISLIKRLVKSQLGSTSSVTLKKMRSVRLLDGKLDFRVKKQFVELTPCLPPKSINFDLGDSQEISVKSIVRTIIDSIRYQTLRDGIKRNYLLRRGLTQGGRLSAVLCELYYSDLEKTHLSKFSLDRDGKQYLIRAVDDYIFLTTDRSQAQKFLLRMEKGFPDYGCTVNAAKTATNFNPESSVLPTIQVTVPFFGLLLNTATLHITGNYELYKGLNIRHTLSIKSTQNPGRELKKRMLQVNTLKLSPILLDGTYNTFEVIYKNIFLSSMLMAYRFYALVDATFDSENYNQDFLTDCITCCASAIAKRATKFSKDRGKWMLQLESCLWIVYKSFHLRLREFSTMFNGVIANLRYLLGQVMRNIDSKHKVLLKAVTCRIPLEFKTTL